MAQEQVAAGPDRITALITPCLIVMESYASTNHVTPAQLHRRRRQRDGRVSLLQDSSWILNMQDALQIKFIITMSANVKHIYTQPFHPTPITLPFTFYVEESFLSEQITLLMITLYI